ncbi:PREDICTED: uncharacterized protein LOC105977380 [Erythranthe guttata]|uniref:uncharacterized protein LOC105977380 n=1 Tax=Erythranthe guttata TaxID=4155 RepID=UPI00064D79AD|nr:PREDICTED: uncharacterized protein LOC105977380 [Erythranthe guttata]|eukprot:XP_012858134.1 PREDICTED: uncharacterized protein LOC105977380 [Erythranthe guttata]
MEIEGNPLGNSIDAWRHCIRGENQFFKDPDDFRHMLKNYSIANNRSFKYMKNDQQKIIAVCIHENCKWRVYASLYKSDKLFSIRKCNLEHTCGDATLRTRGHPKADATWIAQIMKRKLRTQPAYTPCGMLEDIRDDYGLELQYYTAWRGKEKAMRDIHGDETTCYDKLRRYCRALKMHNPGSMAEYEIEPATQKFIRIFISFGSSISGFHRCRPMICLDGTHIKNKYKGCLLSAVCKDPNDSLYTLAYAVVDAENDKNWEWFCIKLKQILDLHNDNRSFTIFSDRHSGLLKAVPMVFPTSHHAYCLRHLVDNFRTQVLRKYPLHNKSYWASVLHNAAYAPTRQEFDATISRIVQSMPLAASFISNSDPNHWANAYFSGERWGIVNNNQAENWNGWVKDARSLPVPSMIDHIRIKIMEMLVKRQGKSLAMTGILCKKILKRLTINHMASRSLKYCRSSSTAFEVYDEDKSYKVDLQQKTCSCKAWQLEKLPCKHACACLESKGYSVYEFVDPCFHIDTYKQVYQFTINPIPSFDEDFDLYDACNAPPDVFVNAPDSRTRPGRRKTKRIPSQVQTRKLNCTRRTRWRRAYMIAHYVIQVIEVNENWLFVLCSLMVYHFQSNDMRYDGMLVAA